MELLIKYFGIVLILFVFTFKIIDLYDNFKLKRLYKNNIDIKEYCNFDLVSEYNAREEYESLFKTTRIVYDKIKHINKDILLLLILENDLGNRSVFLNIGNIPAYHPYETLCYVIVKYFSNNFNLEIKHVDYNVNGEVIIHF